VPSLIWGMVVVSSILPDATPAGRTCTQLCENVRMASPTAIATLHTNHGDIVVNLFGDHAPQTVKNFVGLADGSLEWTHPATGKPGDGPLYKDVAFHRIIPGFMIQGGDPLGQGTGGPGYNFNDEIHPELDFQQPYKLAMANAGLRRNAITGKSEAPTGRSSSSPPTPPRGSRASTRSSARWRMPNPAPSSTRSPPFAPARETAPSSPSCWSPSRSRRRSPLP